MAETIICSYEALEKVINAFDQQSEEIGTMYNKLQSQIDGLRTEWIGAGGDAFFGEMEGEILPAVQRLVAAMNEGSSVASRILQRFRSAEDESRSVWNPY